MFMWLNYLVESTKTQSSLMIITMLFVLLDNTQRFRVLVFATLKIKLLAFNSLTETNKDKFIKEDAIWEVFMVKNKHKLLNYN